MTGWMPALPYAVGLSLSTNILAKNESSINDMTSFLCMTFNVDFYDIISYKLLMYDM